MHASPRRRLAATAGLLLSAGTLGLMTAPAAQAVVVSDTNAAYWTGADTTALWSSSTNWDSSGKTPSASDGILDFQDLGTTCDNGTSSDTCYLSTDDLGAYTASELVLDDANSYTMTAKSGTNSSLTLTPAYVGATGLYASPQEGQFGYTSIGIPVHLGITQQWNIFGGSYGDDVGVQSATDDGNGYALTANLQDGNLGMGTVTTGRLTLEGNGNFYSVSPDGSAPPTLPTAGVTINGGTTLYVEAPGDTSGPIDASGGSGNGLDLFAFQAPEAQLSVTGAVTLNGSAFIGFAIDGNDPSTDASELTATSVNFAGAGLFLDQGGDNGNCDTLQAGKSFTLVSASGGLSGDLSYVGSDGNPYVVDEGQTSALPTAINNDCGGATSALVYLTYGQNTLTATVAGAPASTTAPTIAGTAAVGQTLNVSSNGGWSGFPAPD